MNRKETTPVFSKILLLISNCCVVVFPLLILEHPSLFSLRNSEYKLVGKLCRLYSKINRNENWSVNCGFRNVKELSALNIAEHFHLNFRRLGKPTISILFL
jgi:hypothetical protein